MKWLQTGNCAQCNAPIWSIDPNEWNKDTPPTTKFSCTHSTIAKEPIAKPPNPPSDAEKTFKALMDLIQNEANKRVVPYPYYPIYPYWVYPTYPSYSYTVTGTSVVQPVTTITPIQSTSSTVTTSGYIQEEMMPCGAFVSNNIYGCTLDSCMHPKIN